MEKRSSKSDKKEKPVKTKKTTAVAKTEKPAEPAKTVKTTKKAPAFFRKQYTEKKLNAKIYKKIYIPDDKAFLKSLIVETGKKGKKQVPVFGIPKDKLFSKKDYKRLNTLAKQIKSQKGRFKVAPFAAVVIFIAAIGLGFTLTKNIVIKKVLQSTCEAIFEAKCDIESVSFKFFYASLRIKKFEIANKNDTMKDLVYIDSIALDFDLAQALRARFVSDELFVLGVETEKERSYDGSLSKQKLAKLEKKKQKAAKKAGNESALGKAIAGKVNGAKDASMEVINGLFDQYNPENLAKNAYDSLKTPAVAKKVQEEVPAMITKWQNKPAEIGKKINDTQASIQELINYDYQSAMSDPVKAAEMIKKIDEGMKLLDSIKNDTSSVFNDFQADTNQVTALSTEIAAAIKADQAYAAEQINKIQNFSIQNAGQSVITDILNKVMYSLLGKYYPYYQQATAKLGDMKSSSANQSVKEKKAKDKKAKVKKEGVARAAGRNVIYRADTVPKFWIKKVSGSGTGFSMLAQNISSDMNKLGLPATGKVDLVLKSIDHHGEFIVDTREKTSNPLVTLDYTGANFPFQLKAEDFGGGPGTPSFDGKTKINAVMKIFDAEEFSLSGKGWFDNLAITTVPFEPEYASKIYSNVMSSIKSMTVGVDSNFSVDKGLTFNLTSDADKQFMNGIAKEMNNQLAGVKDKLMSELNAKLDENSKDALAKLGDFNSIQGQMDGYKNKLTELQNQLENKKKEAQNSTKKAAEKAATDVKNKAVDDVKKQAGNMLKGLF